MYTFINLVFFELPETIELMGKHILLFQKKIEITFKIDYFLITKVFLQKSIAASSTSTSESIANMPLKCRNIIVLRYNLVKLTLQNSPLTDSKS